MRNRIVAVAKTDVTGKIYYFVQVGKPLCVGICQQRGIVLKSVQPFCGNFRQANLFMQQLAFGKATAVSLKDLCEDYKNE